MLMIKSLLLAVAIVPLAASATSAQGHPFDIARRVRGGFVALTPYEAITNRVRALDRMVYRVGWGLEPGEFYALSQECLRSGTLDDFRHMLLDATPLVRAMGLICLAQSVGSVELADAAAALNRDKAVLTYTNGYIPDQWITVGALARKLIERQFFIAGEGVGRH
jgi:hypothetical protein